MFRNFERFERKMRYIVKQNFWTHTDNEGKEYLNIGTYFMIVGAWLWIWSFILGL
jgi:hypothetical protein